MRRLVEKLWILFFARVLMSVGFSVSFPYLALYLNKQRGVPMHWVGTLLAFNILASALSAAAGGALSDRMGRKPVMLLSLISRCLVIFGMYLAVDAVASFWVIAALHFGSSTLGSLFDPASSAWVADTLPHHERVKAYGFMRTGGNLGWAIGPALGGLAAGHAYAQLFLWTSAVYAAVSVLVFFFVRESSSHRAPFRFRLAEELEVLRDPKLRRLCVGAALLGVTMAQLIAPLSLYAVRFGGLVEKQVGYLFSMNGGIVAVFQVGMVYVLRRRRLTTQLMWGGILYAAGYAVVGFAQGFAPMAVAMVVITLGEITGAPAEQALAANIAPPEQRGRYIGAASLAQQAGWALGPLGAGLLLDRLGPMKPSPYWLGVSVVALAASAVFSTMRGLVEPREEGVQYEEAVVLQPAL